MNYIYDVLCNFQNVYYDFYDWNKTDDILRIRKIPIIKVNDEVYLDLKNNNVKVSYDFLENIKNKTEVFKNKYIDKINYSCIIANNLEAFIIRFDNKGNSIYKSSMLIDEEREVLEDINDYNCVTIKYEIVSKNKLCLYTRNEEFYINKITKDIDKFYNNKEYEKLKYLYYECFNLTDDNYTKIKNELINSLTDYTNIVKINNFIKMTNA